MSVGLYSGVSGLSLGTGLYRDVSGLWGGASGLIDGFGGSISPTLILDFVGPSVSGASLGMSFVTEPLGLYETYTADASQPSAGFINLQAWS